MPVNSARTVAEPRQKRALETRAALLAAVERIVAAEGPEAVTTTRVAGESGTAVGTIYRYFADRDAMLLEAYDETVGRIVATCRAALETLPQELAVEEAAKQLLGVYLAAAEAIPSHSGLLAAMRRLRPVEADRPIEGDRIVTEIVAPFLARFGSGPADPLRFALMSALLGTMVDLYLVTPDLVGRAMLREEIEAHVVFMVRRAV